MHMHKYQIALSSFILATAATGTAMANFTIGGNPYGTVGATETLSATFTQADGGVTTGSYFGLVQITVSGIGESSATSLNDAFYVYTDDAHTPVAPSNHASFYQLAFDTSALIGTNGVPTNPALDARAHIVFDIDDGAEVTPTYVPTYRADHTYSIVLDTGTLVGTNLHFGVSNGNFGDNSGAYGIEITQLQTVPAPAAGLLAMVGLGSVAFLRRRA